MSIAAWSTWSESERKGVHEISEALETIAAQTKSWTESNHGLSVFTRDGAAKDQRQAKRMADIRAQRGAEQANLAKLDEPEARLKRRPRKPATPPME